MVMESEGNSSVEGYRTTSFPLEWALDQVLLENIAAVDPTIVELNGRWWLVVTNRESRRVVFDRAQYLSRSQPARPMAPARVEPGQVRHPERASGWPSIHGRWSRLSSGPGLFAALRRRDRSQSYRCASETEYREAVVDRIDPRWAPGLVGTHTINAHSELTAVDALAQRPRFEKWARKKVRQRR